MITGLWGMIGAPWFIANGDFATFALLLHEAFLLLWIPLIAMPLLALCVYQQRRWWRMLAFQAVAGLVFGLVMILSVFGRAPLVALYAWLLSSFPAAVTAILFGGIAYLVIRPERPRSPWLTGGLLVGSLLVTVVLPIAADIQASGWNWAPKLVLRP